MNTRALALLLAAAALVAGCAPSATMQTPSGFAVLDGQKEYVYRASSAEGVVLGVRAEKNEPRGNLDFWADALDRQLRREGYVADGEAREVRSGSGVAGRQHKYTREQGGRTQRFWLTVFVTEGRVWVVEAGGDGERFKEKAQKGVQRAIETLQIG